jgi:hypothetical protein
MFVVNDDMSIYLTRGDTAIFSVTADNNGKNYVFRPGDVVRMKVTEKKACENVIFQKDFPVTEEAEKVDILLTEEETKIGEVISKPTDYWYEIELNPYTNPQTIVGYDDDGAKILKLFPEGRDLEPTPVTPEDIPVVDAELSLTSDRPVQNQAIARTVTVLREDIKAVRGSVTAAFASCEERLSTETKQRSEADGRLTERINNLVANTGEQTQGNAELIDMRVGSDGKTYATAGEALRTQVRELEEDACKINLNSTNTSFTIGKMIWTNGAEYDSNATAITGYIPVYGGEIVRSNHFKDINGVELIDCVVEYSDMSVAGYIARTNIENGGSVILSPNTKYIRFSFGRGTSSGVIFTESDLAYFDVDITNLYNRISAEFSQTLNNRMEATSNDSMDNLTNFGIYGWTYGSVPYDCPINDAGLMLVFQFSAKNNPNYGRLVQKIFTEYGELTRYRTTTKFTSWQLGSSVNTSDSVKISAFGKKCLTSFVALEDVRTSSNATPYFLEGVNYNGVPYSAVHYLSKDAFYNLNLETVFSLFNNPESVLYNYVKPREGVGNVYTGGVCSSFVSWVTNQPIYYTTYDMIKMLNFKTINDIEDIEIGDVLICHSSFGDADDHAMIVSNIITSIEGVTAVEISEMWMPLFRKVLYSKEKFMGLLDGKTREGEKYRVGRFDNHTIRTIPPVVVNNDIVTEFGDNTYFELGEDVFIQSTNDRITIESETGTKSIIDLSGFPQKGNMRNISSALNSVGRWTLYGTNNEKSHITVIKKGSATVTDNKLTVSEYEGCKPCGYATIVIRTDGIGDYETHIESDEYTASRLTIYSKDDPRYAGTLNGNEQNIDVSDLVGKGYVGYYVRIFYNTGCGQAHKDTNIVYF